MSTAGKANDTEGTPLRAFIYARTSSDDGDTTRNHIDVSRKESTEVQAKECRELCKRNGYTVVSASEDNDAFEEKDFSGRTYPAGYEVPDPAFETYFNKHIGRPNKRSRSKLGELLNRIGEVDLIVVRDVSRLMRPVKHSHLGNFILQFLSQHGVQIHSISEGKLDPDNIGNLITTNLGMMVSDDAKRVELEKSLAGLKQKKDSGWLTTGVSFYGFESSGHQKMRPIPDQLEVVRYIFKRFLEGTTIIQIARELNDQLKKPTGKNSSWKNHTVRTILGRPAYAGLSRNSAGRLIESNVFKKHAVISESDFLAVARRLKTDGKFLVDTDHSKAERKDRLATKGYKRGGRPLGSSDHRGPCHPFSGLVKCGHCGKHLYISKIVNKFFYDKPAAMYYYQCLTPLFTKAPKSDECRHVRVLESYPADVLAQTKKPTGHGLLEALFPILFVAYIKKFIDESGCNKEVEQQRSAIEEKIAELQKEERTLTNQFLPALASGDTYAKEQFDNLMAERRAEMKVLKDELRFLSSIQHDALLEEVTVPADYFTDPSKISMETLRTLAHQVITSITVYPDRIKVAFVDHGSMTIERVRNRNSRLLPFWRAVVDTPKISAKTKLIVSYFYKSTQVGIFTPITALHQSPNLEVLSVGNNDSVDSTRHEIHRDPSPLNEMMSVLAKNQPSHRRVLNISSSIFFPEDSGFNLPGSEGK